MKKLKTVLVIFASVLALYLTALFGCFFFEPAQLPSADLSHAGFAFEMYRQFTETANPKLYIRQISAADIITDPDTKLQYLQNTLLVHLTENSDAAIRSISSSGFVLTGRIDAMNLVQLTATDTLSLRDLQEACSQLCELPSVDFALPDYFEVTPESARPSEYEIENTYENNDQAYALIGFSKNLQSVDYPDAGIAVIDSNVDSSEYLQTSNYNDYASWLPDQHIYYSSDHAVHVAGIAASRRNDYMCGLAPGARVYSYNGINNTLSFWLASVAKAVSVDRVGAVNVSMCYNTNITLSAGMEDENALAFIRDEAKLFELCVTSLLDRGFSFNICCAAGNEANNTAYRDFFGFFHYGDKPVLSKLDFLHLLDTPEDCATAENAFFFAGMGGKAGEIVITVGSCGVTGERSSFSVKNAMILAPGEVITSLVSDPILKFQPMSGTSMAAPFVSGVCARLLAERPDLSGAQIRTILLETADSGVLRVDKALERAQLNDNIDNNAA